MKTMLSMQAVCREGKLSNSDRNYARRGRRGGRRRMKRKRRGKIKVWRQREGELKENEEEQDRNKKPEEYKGEE